jgi:hypothetical protein
MGAQLSTRAVALLGTNFVCAHAGDEIRRIARTSFFMDFSREIRAIWSLLNRIGQNKSNEDMAPGGQQSGCNACLLFDRANQDFAEDLGLRGGAAEGAAFSIYRRAFD